MSPRLSSKRIAVAAAITAVLVLLLCGGVGMAVIGGLLNAQAGPYAAMIGCGNGDLVDIGADRPQVGGLDSEQMHNAAIIVQVGQRMPLPPRAWVIAVGTALQESHLRNLGYLGVRNDHDSLGLFQQRPSQGWGTPQQVTDPAYAAREFYERLRKVRGWETMRLTDAAQAVQRSAFPDAYQKWESLAAEVVNALTGGAARAVGVSNISDLKCAGPGEISAAGWTVPAAGGIVSPFRPPQRPSHDGVDLGAPRGTPVRAASSGLVITAMCNASTGNCDVDGSPAVLGCGWYVEILHADDVITRYCHMGSKPLVTVGQLVQVGQQLGKVGSSGNSSGPHLHFEVHLNRDGGSRGAVDPLPFMGTKGAALRG
ncbi:MAG TPA: M23 family metallopeptidase [Micromonosporaceae bacterium]